MGLLCVISSSCLLFSFLFLVLKILGHLLPVLTPSSSSSTSSSCPAARPGLSFLSSVSLFTIPHCSAITLPCFPPSVLCFLHLVGVLVFCLTAPPCPASSPGPPLRYSNISANKLLLFYLFILFLYFVGNIPTFPLPMPPGQTQNTHTDTCRIFFFNRCGIGYPWCP